MCFYRRLVFVAEYHVDVEKHCSDVCCDEFLVPQTDRKSKPVKNSDMKNVIWNQYGEQLAILTPKISKFVDE